MIVKTETNTHPSLSKSQDKNTIVSTQSTSSVPTTLSKELSLEDIIHLSNKIGLEYIERRKEAERLELLRTTVRARLMNKIEEENQRIPEAKLKRLAEASPEYIEFLEKIAYCRSEADKLKIRYESYRSLFEAKRTLISFKKVEMKSL